MGAGRFVSVGRHVVREVREAGGMFRLAVGGRNRRQPHLSRRMSDSILAISRDGWTMTGQRHSHSFGTRTVIDIVIERSIVRSGAFGNSGG